jgi:hypothetical protein
VGLAPTGKAPPCHGAHGERPFTLKAAVTHSITSSARASRKAAR